MCAIPTRETGVLQLLAHVLNRILYTEGKVLENIFVLGSSQSNNAALDSPQSNNASWE